MATLHIEAQIGEIAKTVLMPGDPLRAKYIADNYLTDVKMINTVRNMLGYTGKYKGVEVSVFPSGMGIPSIGIYSYELFNFYGVERIIRIGTCGANSEDIKILDIILATDSYSLSTFPKLFDGTLDKKMFASTALNSKIIKEAINNEINIKQGPIITSDVFNVYVDQDKYMANYPCDIKALSIEMEAFGLFFIANKLNKQAACLLTVTDSPYDDRKLTSKDRQNSLDTMIKLALETCL